MGVGSGAPVALGNMARGAMADLEGHAQDLRFFTRGPWGSPFAVNREQLFVGRL